MCKSRSPRQTTCCGCAYPAIVFLTSGCFLLLGVILVALGVSALEPEEFPYFPDVPAGNSLANALIGIGLITAVVAAAGAIISLTDCTPLLILYAVILILVVMTQIAVGITAAVSQKKLPGALDRAWNNTSQARLCTIQDDLYCCGYADPQDRPCLEEPCPIYPATNITVIVGCDSFVLQQARICFRRVMIAGSVMSVVEVLAAIFSCILAHRIRAAMPSSSPEDLRAEIAQRETEVFDVTVEEVMGSKKKKKQEEKRKERAEGPQEEMVVFQAPVEGRKGENGSGTLKRRTGEGGAAVLGKDPEKEDGSA